MIPLYTQEEFDKAKNETLLPLQCKNCGKTFYIKKHRVWAGIRGTEPKDFCSTKCSFLFKNPLLETSCFVCGKIFQKKKLDVLKSDKHFCCRGCANKYSSRINKEQKTINQKKWANSEIGQKILSCSGKIGAEKTNRILKRGGKGKGYWTKTICSFCGKEFESRIKAKRVFCSKTCHQQTSGGIKIGSSRGKHGWYQGYWCDSSWELAWVIYNLDHGIKFERNKQGFEYEYLGKIHKYYPDFILEDGTYVEIKAVLDEKNKIKISSFLGTLILIRHEGIKQFVDYVIEKHGKDFIKLYDVKSL